MDKTNWGQLTQLGDGLRMMEERRDSAIPPSSLISMVGDDLHCNTLKIELQIVLILPTNPPSTPPDTSSSLLQSVNIGSPPPKLWYLATVPRAILGCCDGSIVVMRLSLDASCWGDPAVAVEYGSVQQCLLSTVFHFLSYSAEPSTCVSVVTKTDACRYCYYLNDGSLDRRKYYTNRL